VNDCYEVEYFQTNSNCSINKAIVNVPANYFLIGLKRNCVLLSNIDQKLGY